MGRRKDVTWDLQNREKIGFSSDQKFSFLHQKASCILTLLFCGVTVYKIRKDIPVKSLCVRTTLCYRMERNDASIE